MAVIKWLFWLLVLILLLAAAAAAFLIIKVDPNDYKAQISKSVEDQTGRTLALDGDIEWNFSPWLGVTLNDFSLSNREGFAPEQMLSAEQAKVQVKLKPLLQQRVEVDQVLLVNPVAYLSVNKAGQTNWADLADTPSDESTAVSADEADEADDKSQVGLLAGGLVVQGISLQDGEVHWNDEQAGLSYTMKQLNLQTGALISGQATALDLSVLLEGTDLPEPINLNLKTNAQLGATFEQLDMHSTAITMQMGQMAVNADVEALNFDLTKQLLVATGVQLKHSNAELFADGSSQTFGTDVLLMNLEDETLDITKFSLATGDAVINGSVQVKQLLSELNYSGQLASNTFSLRQLLQQMGVELDGLSDTALSQLGIKADFNGGLDNISLKQLKMQLDQSQINGFVEVKSFANSAYGFDLDINQLNVDSFLSEASNETAAEADATPAAAVMALPVVALQGLNVNGQLDIGKFNAAGLNAENLFMNIQSSGDIVRIAPLRANLYSGEMQNEVVYDLSSAVPKVRFKSTITGLDIGPFSKALDLSDKLEGISDLNIDLNGAGADIDKLIASLKGKLDFDIKDGAIKGANIQKVLIDAAQTYNKLKGKDVLADVKIGDQSDFSSFGSHFLINNGVLSTNDIELRAPLFRLSGRGTLDLGTQILDMKLVAAVVESLEGQGGQDLAELRGEELPLNITGPVAEPKIRLDVASLLKSQLKKELEKKYLGGQKVDKDTAKKVFKEKLDEELKKEGGKLLKKLFNF